MKMAILQALCLVTIGFVAICGSVPLPKYDNTYLIKGTIRLPYAEIVEPFVAYFDTPNKRSRVDYYDGVSRSFQRGAGYPGYKYGATQEVVYYSDKKVMNKLSCFEANGTSGGSVSLLSVLPDLTGFKFIGQKNMSSLGIKVNMFQLVNTVGSKVSTYTLYTKPANNAPVRYEMMGYDSLIGSHFDKYYVDYEEFNSPYKFTDDDFKIPDGLKCGPFPGPGQASKHKGNPIKELVHRQDDHVDAAFEDFKTAHGKNYHPNKHDTRKHVFRQNLRYINSKNRAGLTYTMKVNHLADLTETELKIRNGYRYTGGDRGGSPFYRNLMSQDVPDEWDWRLIGAVTPVKDQAICGSCWSFGTTGTIEGANFLKTRKLIRLSQQELMDCSWGYGNNACDGGEDFRSYQYIMANGGLSSEALYGPYSGADGKCHKTAVEPVVQLKNYTIIPKGDEEGLKVAIYTKGPISVAIDASHKSLSFYANGVYFEPKCRSDPDGLDHAVLAVGYGELNGKKYWLVKNSWSTYWGNDGYVLMSQKDNNCGVATAASYVEIL